MSRSSRRPFGVMPFKNWAEECPEPTIGEIVARHAEVLAAVERYRGVGMEPEPAWLVELGVHGCINPSFLDP